MALSSAAASFQQQGNSSALHQRSGTLTNLAQRSASNLATLNQVTGGERKITASAFAPYGQSIKQRTQSGLDEKKGKTRRYFGFKSQKDKKQDALKGDIVMDDHYISLDELYARFDSNPTIGLTTVQASAILKRDGLNKLTPPKKIPEWVKLLKLMFTPLNCLLWVAAILSFVAYALSPSPPNLSLGVSLIGVIVVVALFSYVQTRKSSNLMQTFVKMIPTTTTVIRSGIVRKIDASQLVRGDIIELRAGDKVPADVRIIRCSDDLTVDNSGLTGESDPIKRDIICSSENPLETKNLAFFGTYVPSGTGRGIVINTGDRTVMGRIASLSMRTNAVRAPIAKEIDHFVYIVSGFAIITGVLFFVIGIIVGTSWNTNFVFMIGIIVANVPEGLPVSMTASLTRAAQNMASRNVLVKNLESVETLGSTSCICSDKTGTLTQNIMTIANIVYDLKIHDVNTTMSKENFNDKDPSFLALLRCGVLCSTAVWDVRSQFESDPETGELVVNATPIPFMKTINHPDGSVEDKVMWVPIGDASEAGMIKFCQTKTDIVRFREEYPLNQHGRIPFNSTNKYQTHIIWHPHEKHWMVVMKGAPERIAMRCGTILENGIEIPMTEEHRTKIAQLMLTLSRKGMRVLAFAEKHLPISEYPENYHFDSESLNFPIGESSENFEESLKRFQESDSAKSDGSGSPSPRQKETLCYLGMMALIDPPRPQVPAAVQKCKSAGIKVIMVTGDHPETAKAIAKKVGIIWSDTADDIKMYNSDNGLQQGMPGWRDPDLASAIVIPGWDISVNTPKEVWDDILDHTQIVFARTSPQQKLLIVENCQQRGHIVAVTGDGVNDSPALKQADIGIAMGIMGTEVSKEAASMILLDDNFASIVSGVESGRLIFDNLKKTIAYALTANIPELLPFIAFIVFQIPTAIGSIVALLICLVTDMLPAISQSWEKAELDIMSRVPRNPKKDKLVSWRLILFSYGAIGIFESLSGFFAFFIYMNDMGYWYYTMPGLGAGNSWGYLPMMCKTNYGAWRNIHGDLCPCFNPVLTTDLNLALCGVAGTQSWWESDYARDIVITQCQTLGYTFWDQDTSLMHIDEQGEAIFEHKGTVIDCVFPVNQLVGQASSPNPNFDPQNPASYYYNGQLYTGRTPLPTDASIQALRGGPSCSTPSNSGCVYYYEYLPYRATSMSTFEPSWISWDVTNSNVPGFGTGAANPPSIQMEYQPIGTWIVDLQSTQSGASASMGFIGDSVQVSTSSSNPYKITHNIYTQATLDQSTNLPWISTNTLANTGYDSMLQANTQALGLICSTCVISDYYDADWYQEAIGFLQFSRCGNLVNTTSAQVQQQAIAQGSFTCYSSIPDNSILLNVASRQLQNEALTFGQTAYFIAVVFGQIANVIICKTRYLSIVDQTLDNYILDLAILFEMSVVNLVCYVPAITIGMGTRPLPSQYWFAGMAFACFIFLLDESRRYLLRRTSQNKYDADMQRLQRIPGWFERNTLW